MSHSNGNGRRRGREVMRSHGQFDALAPGQAYGAGDPYDDPAAPGSELRGMWEVVRHRRRLVLGVATVVFVAVALGTLLQQPVYRATGTIEFRQQGGEVVPLEALFEVGRIADQHLETQYNVLRSPALARRVVRELGLQQPSDFGEAPRPVQAGFAAPPESPERVVNAFGKRLRVEPIEDSRIVRVSFEAGDAQLAANVVNAVFANYSALRVESARDAIARLSQQVDSVRAKLAVAEQRLQRYAVDNELMFVESADGDTENIVQERMRQLQQQLTEAEAARYEVESRYNLVQRRNYDALASDVLRTLSLRVAELQGEYAKLRTTFTDEYPRTREVKRQLDALTAQLGRERSRIAAEVRGEYQSVVRRQELLQQAFDQQKQLADQLASRTGDYRVLKRDMEGHQQLHTVLQQKLKEAGISAALAPSEINVIDAAVAPEEPARPSPKRNLPLGAIVGLLLGVGLAFVRDYTDSTVRSIEEIDDADVPVLGLIPAMRANGAADHRALRMLNGIPLPNRIRSLLPPAPPLQDDEPIVRIDRDDIHRSPLSEAFSSLRTSVLLQNDGPLPNSLLVTSSQPGEGKTTVSVNLAISMARLGRRVLLIDGDVRRPAVHGVLGIEPGAGLIEYLMGSATWRELVRSDVYAGLDVLSAGTPPQSPSELLSSERMRELIRETEAEYDVVIIDSPALLVNVPDARILAPLAERVVLVVRSGVTPRALLRRILKQAPNLIGVVINDLDPDRLPGYYGRYEADAPLSPEEQARSWREVIRDVTGNGDRARA